jgi:predicted ATPase with chaperone activity
VQSYEIPKIFNEKFPRFSMQNSQDFQFMSSCEELSKADPGELSATIRERVIAARALQPDWFRDVPASSFSLSLAPSASGTIIAAKSREAMF